MWNHLVRSQRHAEREWTHGRAASVKNELLELSLAKQTTGQALVSAREIVLERGVSEQEALGFMLQELVEKVATIPKRKKDGSRGLRIARRRMATRYADAIVNAKVDPDLGTSGSRNLRPRLARDVRFLKRLRRLPRKHDRQRHRSDSDCFDERGIAAILSAL